MSEAAETTKLTTANFDARFPNTNQTKHCWQSYVDYFKCIDVRGEEFEPCKQFQKTYRALCPNEWVEKWDTLREEGRNPSNFKV